MLSQPWTLAQLRAAPLGRCTLWVTASVADTVASSLGLNASDPTLPLPDDIQTLIVAGGGRLIDRSKVVARAHPAAPQIVAIPTIWGSGAEQSRIAVLDDDGKKTFHIDQRLVPEHWVLWPELAASVSPARAMAACGDAWSHALEGFLSPLATPATRSELAAVMQQMLTLPLAVDARWFVPSAQACAAQAHSSVGLVHGIAHQIEEVLRTSTDGEWGHARLCSTYLAPVLALNRGVSDKCDHYLGEYGLDPATIARAVAGLCSREAYQATLPALQAAWPRILRDPCTRTNVVLVRHNHLDYFLQWSPA